MTAFFVVVLQSLACLGLGAAFLRLLRITEFLTPNERWIWAFTAGFGILGWLLFFVGWAQLLSSDVLLGLLLICTPGLSLIGGWPHLPDSIPRPQWLDWLLAGGVLFVVVLGVCQAVAPPADGDTLAYHFEIPKLFLAAGRIEFIPRALEGAVPFLIHMTYMPVLALGGESALMLWALVTSWAAAILTYIELKRHVSSRLAVGSSLVLLTTPVVVAGSVNGQIEIRLALFAIVSGLSLSYLARTKRLRFALLAGVTAGFYMAAKYTGLLFVSAAAVVALLIGRSWRAILGFSLAALLAGFQWYYWNWAHSGDPIFPVLVGGFGFGDQSLWPADFNQWYKEQLLAPELIFPRSLFWLLAFPIVDTFVGIPQFGGARVGLGPFLALLFPMAAWGVWLRGRDVRASSLWPIAILVLVLYVLWFLTGSSQRSRHLMPVYPLALVCFVIAAAWAGGRKRMMGPVAASFCVVLVLQFAGMFVYSLNYLKFVIRHETRDEFFDRNIAGYAAVKWINENLGKNDKILVNFREMTYLIGVPVFPGQAYQDPRIDLRPGVLKPDEMWASLQRYKMTHVLLQDPVAPVWQSLVDNKCLVPIQTFDTQFIASRTLNLRTASYELTVFKMAPLCPAKG